MTKKPFGAVRLMPPFIGRREPATYRDPSLNFYDDDPTLEALFREDSFMGDVLLYEGNPMIEALPPIRRTDQLATQMARRIRYSEKFRGLPNELRFHFISNTVRFFEPLPIHLELAYRFSAMIRKGYQARNPMELGYWSDAEEKLVFIGSGQSTFNNPEPSTLGFGIVGLCGVGKSTGVRAALSLYPQVIDHSSYGGQGFNFTQIVWLKVECPHNGSTKGLCINFFRAIDGILRTEYYKNYTRKGRASEAEMLPAMAHVAGTLHCMGVLVIDEIQNLNAAKSGGKQEMLNFLVEMENTIGLPIVKIGTHAAYDLLGGDAHETRRCEGEGGDLVWDRLRKKPEKAEDSLEQSGGEETGDEDVWNYFLESLWKYQYIRKPCKLTTDLSDVMYDVSQGIIDYAVKVFLLAQTRAIVTGKEEINEVIIRSVAADRLRLAQPILKALRNGEYDAIHQYPDVRIDLDKAMEEEISGGTSHGFSLTDLSRDTENIEQSTAVVGEESFDDPREEPAAEKNGSSQAKKRDGKKLSARIVKGSLPALVAHAAKKKVLPYEALEEAGHIADAAEFLQMDA